MHAHNFKQTPDGNQNTELSRLEELISMYENPVRAIVHGLLEQYVKEEFEAFIGPRIGQLVTRESDGQEVRDYRNGNRIIKQVIVDTLALENFQVPRNRAGGFRSTILERSRRYAGRFATLALELFINGVSTRKVRRSFQKAAMNISGLSKNSVSRISEDLRKEYLKWANRPIKEKFKYLQADAVYIRVRQKSPRKPGTLMIIGIQENGQNDQRQLFFPVNDNYNFPL